MKSLSRPIVLALFAAALMSPINPAFAQDKEDSKKNNPKKDAQQQQQQDKKQQQAQQQQDKKQQQAQKQQDKKQQQAQKQQDRQQQVQPRQQVQQQQQAQQQQIQRQQATQRQASARQPQPAVQQRLAPQVQQQLIVQQQKRTAQYSQGLQRQTGAFQQRSQTLQQQKRTAQYAFQQQYVQRLRQQQLAINAGSYDYNRDPYFNTAPSLRYSRSGRYYEVNQYAAQVLQGAVNHGYDQGFRSGQADRADRWRFDYQNSYAYQDAVYGYDGRYVDQDQYSYYFREGFRRGYSDGYYSRYQYGSRSGASFQIQTGVLRLIINLQPLR